MQKFKKLKMYYLFLSVLEVYETQKTGKHRFRIYTWSPDSLGPYPEVQTVKNLPAVQETRVLSLGWEYA